MQMRLTFIGADHEVTGSCHFLEVGETKVLIDCGMEQGNNVYQNAELPVSYREIDYVFLTHARMVDMGMGQEYIVDLTVAHRQFRVLIDIVSLFHATVN